MTDGAPLTYSVGDFEVTVISDGEFRLDGGAMYGMVPKPRWESLTPADEHNRVRLGMNCLLVRGPDFNLLLETGIGRDWGAKWDEQYGILHPPSVEESLRQVGLEAADITHALCTHLHFDHAGGLPHLPNARLVTQKGELEAFHEPPAYHKRSYAPQRGFDEDRAILIDGEGEPLPGIRVKRTGGHTRDHQVAFVESQGETLLFFGDLLPTVHHLPPLWTMAYDLVPMDVIDRKKELLEAASAEGWLVHFYHDHDPRPGRIVRDGKFYAAERVDPAGTG